MSLKKTIRPPPIITISLFCSDNVFWANIIGTSKYLLLSLLLLQYIQYMREYNAESPKQDSERFNSPVRRNTLPIWLYFFFYGRPGCMLQQQKSEFESQAASQPDPVLNNVIVIKKSFNISIFLLLIIVFLLLLICIVVNLNLYLISWSNSSFWS